jgi:hypothetical protein
MRLASTAHTSRPWRIHELTGDFRLEDVWALPGESGPGDFPRLVRLFASYNPSRSSSRAVRTLFAIRWKLGELFGWDGPGDGLGSRVPTLRDRLPADLREVPSGPQFATGSFSSLYLIEDEWAAGGRQPDRARGPPLWPGPGRNRRRRSSDGCLGEAEWTARDSVHGRD